MSCKSLDSHPMYIKAYTFSRCINKCGMKFTDCSCEDTCKTKGNCCSDYKFCEILEKNKIEAKNITNCEFSTIDSKICLQCMEGFYLYENFCLDKCPHKTKALDNNKICLKYESKKIIWI